MNTHDQRLIWTRIWDLDWPASDILSLAISSSSLLVSLSFSSFSRSNWPKMCLDSPSNLSLSCLDSDRSFSSISWFPLKTCSLSSAFSRSSLKHIHKNNHNLIASPCLAVDFLNGSQLSILWMNAKLLVSFGHPTRVCSTRLFQQHSTTLVSILLKRLTLVYTIAQ